MLGSLNNWNIIYFTNNTTSRDDFDEVHMLLCLLCRCHRITYYYRNPLEHCRTDQPRTKQISLSVSPISKHVIYTYDLDKVTSNYEIYLTEKPTYKQTLSRKLTTFTVLDEHRTERTPPKYTRGVRRITGAVMPLKMYHGTTFSQLCSTKSSLRFRGNPHIRLCVLGSNRFSRT